MRGPVDELPVYGDDPDAARRPPVVLLGWMVVVTLAVGWLGWDKVTAVVAPAGPATTSLENVAVEGTGAVPSVEGLAEVVVAAHLGSSMESPRIGSLIGDPDVDLSGTDGWSVWPMHVAAIETEVVGVAASVLVAVDPLVWVEERWEPGPLRLYRVGLEFDAEAGEWFPTGLPGLVSRSVVTARGDEVPVRWFSPDPDDPVVAEAITTVAAELEGAGVPGDGFVVREVAVTTTGSHSDVRVRVLVSGELVEYAVAVHPDEQFASRTVAELVTVPVVAAVGAGAASPGLASSGRGLGMAVVAAVVLLVSTGLGAALFLPGFLDRRQERTS